MRYGKESDDENPKFKALNSKQTQMLKIQNLKHFERLSLEFWVCLEFRCTEIYK